MSFLPPSFLPVPALVALASTVVLGVCEPSSARAQTATPQMAASASTSAASAAASEAEEGAVRVEITAVREPLEYPYERAYNASLKVREASHGNTDLVVSIIEAHPTGTPLRVSLQYGETVERLDVDPSNSFTLSPNGTALENHAILVTNRRRDGLSVRAGLRPHVEPGATLTRADINRLVEGGKAARRSLLPWYARVVMPTVSGVRICSRAAGAQFALRDPGGADRALAAKDDKDVYERSAHCVDLPPTDDAREAAMSVVMPAGSTMDYAPTAF